MVVAKWNYKVYADLGLHTQVMVRYFTVLNTGAGPKFVVKSVLPLQLQTQVKTHAISDI